MTGSQRIERSDQMVAIFELLKTSSWYEKKIGQLLKPYDVSHEQYNVLRILEHNNPRSFTLKEIQSRLLNKTANTTRLVEKLKQKGYLTTKQQKSDRRALRITISNKGLNALKKINRPVKEMVKKINKSIGTDESKVVMRILRDLRKMTL